MKRNKNGSFKAAAAMVLAVGVLTLVPALLPGETGNNLLAQQQDKDGDGVNDLLDVCPNEKGTLGDGCPPSQQRVETGTLSITVIKAPGTEQAPPAQKATYPEE